jgi:hypothetical protein
MLRGALAFNRESLFAFLWTDSFGLKTSSTLGTKILKEISASNNI